MQNSDGNMFSTLNLRWTYSTELWYSSHHVSAAGSTAYLRWFHRFDSVQYQVLPSVSKGVLSPF